MVPSSLPTHPVTQLARHPGSCNEKETDRLTSLFSINHRKKPTTTTNSIDILDINLMELAVKRLLWVMTLIIEKRDCCWRYFCGYILSPGRIQFSHHLAHPNPKWEYVPDA
jgi:hypothetical protein